MTIQKTTTVHELAGRWLAAERAAVTALNARGTELGARNAEARYEAAVASATPDELLVGWQAARRHQAAREVGTREWDAERSVTELLGAEYLRRTQQVSAMAAPSQGDLVGARS